MTKKIISTLLALTMLLMTACGENNSVDTSKAEKTATTAVTERTDDSSDGEDTASATTTTTTEVTTTTTAETTSKKSTTTSVSTTAEQTSTTKAAVQTTARSAQTTRVSQKPVVTTSTTKASKAVAVTTTTAAKTSFDIEAYRKQTISEINKLFPEAKLDRSLYDRFERLCRGIETKDDMYQIKEQLCNFALRKYSGKTGTIEYISDIYGENDSIFYRSSVTAAKPINISIDRTLEEDDAHQNNGAMTNLVYITTYETWRGDYQEFVKRNYDGICTFIKDCYCMMSSGIPSLVIRQDNKYPQIDHKHKFYVFISPGYLNYSTGTKEHYLWFCEG